MHKFSFLAAVCILASASACSKSQPASPTSPTTTAAAPGGAAADGATLKANAPMPQSPVNNARPEGPGVTLTVVNAGIKYTPGDGVQFTYRFQVFDAANNLVEQALTPSGIGTTSHAVTAKLDADRSYSWQVRVEFQGQPGPWSSRATFIGPALRQGYLRGNELFDPLMNGQTVATNMNAASMLPGVGVQLTTIDSFVEYRLEMPLTDGQFSVVITNLRNSNEDWKTKVMSMLQGDGIDITDNPYRFTVDRRNRDSGGTVRYTLRSRGVDAGEPNCGNASWDPTHLYLWTYTWSNGSSNLTVRDGGGSGPVVRSCGATYKTPYSPNPHLIRLGSVFGRAGSETLPNATFRNVWVSPNPRPNFPGDTP